MLSRFPLLLVLFALAACDTARPSAQTDPTPLDLSPLAVELIEQNTDFGLGLFAETGAEGNVMLSPLSASILLTMLLNGTDGETYAQIHEMLGYADGQDLDAVNEAYQSLRTQLLAADPAVDLALANAVFTDARFTAGVPFKVPFLSRMTTAFDALVQDLDFAAPSTLDAVNGWASENTNGRVPKVLDEIDPDLMMLLMNAVYFNGEWSTRFDPARTADAGFELADGTTVQVPMMTGEVRGRAVLGDGYHAAELPYGRGNFSMVAIVPRAPLAELAGRLRDGLWDEVTRQFDAAGDGVEVSVRLPRFEFSSDELLNDQLQALGMTDAFDAGRADLTRMHDDPRLEVSFVKQNTFVSVDERGTEAAAVTTGGVRAVSLGPHLFADRPFVFAIRERTSGALLFIGQVADPR